MPARFATTRWSLVLAARDEETADARSAFADLFAIYWDPLYAFLRRRGCDVEEARDVAQAYFTSVLEKGTLGSVDPSRGRFRSFLLVSARHFLADEIGRRNAKKRGGGARDLSLETEEAERGYRALAVDDTTPEAVFERRWAQTVVARALDRLRREHEDRGGGDRFRRLSPFLVEGGEGGYREVAEALGTTEGAVKTSVHRMRQRFGALLRAEVAETVRDEADVEDELRCLLRALR